MAKEEKDKISGILDSFRTLSSDEKAKILSILLSELTEKKSDDSYFIPIGIFANERLSSLEAIVKYLFENHKLKFSKIAKLLGRSNKTIWATYKNSIRKFSAKLERVSHEIMIPASAFANRDFSTLECLVDYIKNLGHTNHEIGMMLKLDDRTIWTVYDRVKKKRGNQFD